MRINFTIEIFCRKILSPPPLPFTRAAYKDKLPSLHLSLNAAGWKNISMSPTPFTHHLDPPPPFSLGWMTYEHASYLSQICRPAAGFQSGT